MGMTRLSQSHYVCDTCQQDFRSHSAANAHIRLHHDSARNKRMRMDGEPTVGAPPDAHFGVENRRRAEELERQSIEASRADLVRLLGELTDG